jgi:hypothetical protein
MSTPAATSESGCEYDHCRAAPNAQLRTPTLCIGGLPQVFQHLTDQPSIQGIRNLFLQLSKLSRQRYLNTVTDPALLGELLGRDRHLTPHFQRRVVGVNGSDSAAAFLHCGA